MDYRNLHENKKGYVSDKWNFYLDVYSETFKSYQEKKISLLEIGVQNGGSLEVWSQYFKHAKKIVGCDINTDCNKLEFPDPRIELVIGDSTKIDTINRILDKCDYDIIIDDGAHTSSSIIKSFCHLFPHLNDGGIYLIEDLHCSYWESFEGGLDAPFAAMTFLKKLADVINHEHWGVDKPGHDYLRHQLEINNVVIDDTFLSMIHSVHFYNSICVIYKKKAINNVLGPRYIRGEEKLVTPDVDFSLFDGKENSPIDQSGNYWSNLQDDIGVLYIDLLKSNSEKDNKIHELDIMIQSQKNEFKIKYDQEIEELLHTLNEKENDIKTLQKDKEEKAILIENIRSDIKANYIQIESLTMSINEKSDRLEILNSEYEKKKQLIIELNNSIDVKNNKIENLFTVINKKEKALNELAKEEKNNRFIISDLNDVVNSLKAEIHTLKSKKQGVESCLEYSFETINQLKSKINKTTKLIKNYRRSNLPKKKFDKKVIALLENEMNRLEENKMNELKNDLNAELLKIRKKRKFWYSLLMPLRLVKRLAEYILKNKKTKQVQSDIRIVKESGLFDDDFYIQSHDSYITNVLNPLRHFVANGYVNKTSPHILFDFEYYKNIYEINEGNAFIHYLKNPNNNPHVLFNTAFYLSQNPNMEGFSSPLLHFLEKGWKEGINPHPLFDISFYLQNVADLEGQNPLEHYLTQGGANNIDPHPLFNSKFYLKEYGYTKVTPLESYLLEGWTLYKNPSAYFDVPFYLNKYEDVKNAEIEPLSHFCMSGWRELRLPNFLFDTGYYLTVNNDVAEAGINPLIHYVSSGYLENRNFHALFNISYYKQKYMVDTDLNPIEHYLTIGDKLHISPCELFISDYYLDVYEDVKNADLNPFRHFIEYGAFEGRECHPFFNAGFYLQSNPDVLQAKINPLAHFIEYGWKENRNPHPFFHIAYYKQQYNIQDQNPLLHYTYKGWIENFSVNEIISNFENSETDFIEYTKIYKVEIEKSIKKIEELNATPNAMDVVASAIPETAPIPVYYTNGKETRVNLITDSLQKHSLFGGTATCLILTTLFCNENNLPLRLITRNSIDNLNDYAEFIKLFGIEQPKRVELYCDYERILNKLNTRLEIRSTDLFFTTSWWTTEIVSRFSINSKIMYFNQEIEEFFYEKGYRSLLNTELLKKDNIRFLFNSPYLFEYYKITNNDLLKKGVYFNPAFSDLIYRPSKQSFKEKKKKKLVFYARPNHPRNIYFRGLELLEEAYRTGLLNEEEWELYFMGSEVAPVKFLDRIVPKYLNQMTWIEYGNFIRTVDLGLSLMVTPHPSYPPMDIAASGGVVYTNKFMNKQENIYSDNIICGSLEPAEFINDFAKALDLVYDVKKRKENYMNQNMNTDWNDTYNEIKSFIKAELLNE